MRHQENSSQQFLLISAICVAITFSVWQALLNNFSVEHASFTGTEIGMLQTLREIPGFLAFGAVFLLLLLKEQYVAVLSLAILSIGVGLTGFFPTSYGLYATTIIMSIGFHYFETINTSLQIQWLGEKEAPAIMGTILSKTAMAALLTFTLIWCAMEFLQVPYWLVYLIAGILGCLMALYLFIRFPLLPQKTVQHKHLVLRKRYWLYYALVFMSGARRQIFVVFAGFLMVDKFGFSVENMAMLFIINQVATIWLAPKIGRFVGYFGERKILMVEYMGLILVFVAYALVDNHWIASSLYVIDNIFFAMAIATKTYFQKIASPEDIASTSGVSFTINHIAAVILPVFLGMVWMINPAWVFYIGAGMAVVSLVLALLVPHMPKPGHESLLQSTPSVASA
ncbi:MFS transporter [Shewanella surugensis]|uniref:MFS transporter n=1 Tax=Shewanella surugensis TaxID=212020 RepID=A0ABT0LDV1_9GAMM|nr:MFS transporter [Shewanella surugensis]MCL1125883.1 MFS transporter [Shewanella surugensis]